MIIRLPESLAAWGTPEFAAVLKRELRRLGADALPLQQALTASSAVAGNDIEVMVITVGEEPACLSVRVGIFYAGIVAGCNCADDPTPVEAQNEYCELRLDIDRWSGETAITPVS